jgi:hypothetical protein
VDKKTRYDKLAAWHIYQVIELCYRQGVPTTWRDIYEFLRVPEHVYEGESDLDEVIHVSNDYELEQMRLLLEARFTTLH